MIRSSGEDFEAAWKLLDLPVRRSLTQAYAALRAGGLGCGAAMTDATGSVVAESRNHAYDAPGGEEVLQGTPIAHAEMNVLAAASTDRDLSTSTLWTTQEPCSMCTAAMAFTGVGTVRYVAPDPWAIATGQSRSTDALGSADGDGLRVVGPIEDGAWLVSANVIFMLSIGRARGSDHPTIARNAELEPETTRIVRRHLSHQSTAMPDTLEEFLEASWDQIRAAAAERAEADRRGRTLSRGDLHASQP